MNEGTVGRPIVPKEHGARAALLAFAPALWRAAAGLRLQATTLNLRRLGWSEVGLTAGFVPLLNVSL